VLEVKEETRLSVVANKDIEDIELDPGILA